MVNLFEEVRIKDDAQEDFVVFLVDTVTVYNCTTFAL